MYCLNCRITIVNYNIFNLELVYNLSFFIYFLDCLVYNDLNTRDNYQWEFENEITVESYVEDTIPGLYTFFIIIKQILRLDALSLIVFAIYKYFKYNKL